MFFFFNDTATTEIYTLSLHDALPISGGAGGAGGGRAAAGCRSGRARRHPHRRGQRLLRGRQRAAHGRGEFRAVGAQPGGGADRKSTRLNSSHANISYAVFCLKKKKHT